VKKRESGLAYASGRIQPSPLPLHLQATRANEPFPARVHLRRLGGGTIQLPEQKKHYFNLQTFKCFKQVIVYYMATLPEC
jgi:hypothetical protein